MTWFLDPGPCSEPGRERPFPPPSGSHRGRSAPTSTTASAGLDFPPRGYRPGLDNHEDAKSMLIAGKQAMLARQKSQRIRNAARSWATDSTAKVRQARTGRRHPDPQIPPLERRRPEPRPDVNRDGRRRVGGRRLQDPSGRPLASRPPILCAWIASPSPSRPLGGRTTDPDGSGIARNPASRETPLQPPVCALTSYG